MNDYVTAKHGISKKMSANDIGLNGSHQAGILIPKNNEILSFFPKMNSIEKNPRVIMRFFDENQEKWNFNFIFYNNKYFGGTRNEYRLTCMTSYIRMNDLRVGDEIIFSLNFSGERFIRFKRVSKGYSIQDGVIRLSDDWKIIKI